jgi:hypothetical protein
MDKNKTDFALSSDAQARSTLMLETIQVFVGCDPNDCDLEQMMVLDYSIRSRCSQPVNIHWMQLSRDPQSFWYSNPQQQQGWRTEAWTTPFSGFRWGIPAFCDYQGKAIYMDTDVIVLCDLAELWNAAFEPGKVVMAKGGEQSWRFCVSMWDCAEARNHLPAIDELRGKPEIHQQLKKYYKKNPQVIQPFDTQYNNIDGENSPVEQIKILHYSDMGTQFSHALSFARLQREGRAHWFDGTVLPHPRQDLQALFEQHYQQALDAGYSLDNYRMKQVFGPFPKYSQKTYTGNDVTRPKHWWTRLGLFKALSRKHHHAK